MSTRGPKSKKPMTAFGKRVMAAKERRGFATLEELATAAGTTYRNLYSWLRGTRPDVEAMAALAAALGTSVDALLGSDATATSDERDRGTPNVEAFIAGQQAVGTPLDDEVAAHLRGMLHRSGDVSFAAIEAELRAFLATRAGRGVAERPSLTRPVETDRGQRPLPPARRP